MSTGATCGLVGYHPQRLAALVRLTALATEGLDAMRSDDPVAADALRTVRRVSHGLQTRWLPLLARASADPSMTSWAVGGGLSSLTRRDGTDRDGTDRDGDEVSARIDFLLGTSIGRMYLDVIECAVQGSIADADGDTSADDIDRAADDPARVGELVAQWGLAHGIELDEATIAFLVDEIVTTARAMQRTDGEPWNEMHGAMQVVAREAMTALVVSVPADVGLDLVRIAGDPSVASAWWSSLPPGRRDQLVAAAPAVIGNTDGIPAVDRNTANRIQLDADLASTDAPARRNALAVDEYLAAAEQHVDPLTGEPAVVQLYIYEPAAFDGAGRVAIATGDLDTADHVAVAVPGFGSDVSNMSPDESQNIYDESRRAGGGSVAILDWMGYDAPSFDYDLADAAQGDVVGLVDAIACAAGVATMQPAREGAALLVGAVEGIAVMRDTDPHLTVIGHSYGSTLAATAAADFGLQADDLVLTGSPGAGSAGSADDLTTGRDHTWVASPSSDLITFIGHNDGGIRVIGPLGNDPAMDTFGAIRIRSEHFGRGTPLDPLNLIDEHQSQFQPGSESLYNVAAIVAGDYAAVQQAQPRHQEHFVEFHVPVEFDADRPFPWNLISVEVHSPIELNPLPDDPEAGRDPAQPTHEPE